MDQMRKKVCLSDSVSVCVHEIQFKIRGKLVQMSIFYISGIMNAIGLCFLELTCLEHKVLIENASFLSNFSLIFKILAVIGSTRAYFNVPQNLDT